MIVAQANGQVGGLVIERGDDGVVVVRLNRPERRNMIDTVTAQQLTTLFIAANTDSSIRSFLITGVADVYCTGADAVSAADTPTPGTLEYR